MMTSPSRSPDHPETARQHSGAVGALVACCLCAGTGCATGAAAAAAGEPSAAALQPTAAPPAPWHRVEDARLGFAALFPVAPEVTQEVVPYGMVQTQVTKHVAAIDGVQLEIDVVEYPLTVVAMLAANPDALLHGAAETLAHNTGGTLTRKEEAEVGGRRGLHVETSYPDGWGESYLVFYGARLYRVRALQRGGEPAAQPPRDALERFFSSFELHPPPTPQEAAP